MKTFYTTILAAASIAACALNGQATGSVAGTVLENGSFPLGGATVSYSAQGHFEKDSRGRLQYVRPQIGGTVQSHADGTFTITGLPAGKYVICARGTLPVHISSCAWDASDHRVSIAAGQNQTGLRLAVTRGALLDINIFDSAGCAARNSKAPVYVFVNSLSQVARPVSTAAGAYHYQALVPQQVAVKVSSNHPCSFTDSSNSALPSAALSIPPIQGETASVTMTAR